MVHPSAFLSFSADIPIIGYFVTTISMNDFVSGKHSMKNRKIVP